MQFPTELCLAAFFVYFRLAQVLAGGPLAMDLREIISRALADSDFRCSLLSDPKAVIERCLGVSLPPEVKLWVHQDTETEIHLVLPYPMSFPASVESPPDR